jgi:iron complex transport system ATP-binding protein
MGTIELRDACYSYDGKTDIFTNLNCTFSTDDIFCILGPNGTGKSTLLDAIMNLHPLTSGSVILDGKKVGEYTAAEFARKVSYIPQTYHLAFPFQVLDLILMGRTPHLNSMNRPSEKDYDKVMEAVHELGLEPYLDRSCTQLSGGQLQMVMLARAIAQEAEFIVLDEPTSHLDYGKQMETLRLLHKMHERGAGVLFTTHSPDHAFLVCNKVAIMNKGTFECVGDPNEVVTEERLTAIYGIPMQIISYGEDGRGKVCAPRNAVMASSGAGTGPRTGADADAGAGADVGAGASLDANVGGSAGAGVST